MGTVTVETPLDAITARALLYRALKALIIASGQGAREPLRSQSLRAELAREATAAAEIAMALYPGDEGTCHEIAILLQERLRGDHFPERFRAALPGIEPKPSAASVKRNPASSDKSRRSL
jgi:hypothetical protein